jgi:creatinine amidohydrolase
MGFAGTIALKPETIIQVHMEAIESLIHHGFKRFIIMNAHGGNTALSTLLVDKVNQSTAGIAVNFDQAVAPFMERSTGPTATQFDRHGGTPETSSSLYLIPSLVQLEKAVPATLKLPDHMEKMLPQVIAEDPTAKLVFLAEGLKAQETGKKTSSKEMSSTGVWGTRDPKESTVERGADATKRSTAAAVKFIDKWNELRPYPAKK